MSTSCEREIIQSTNQVHAHRFALTANPLVKYTRMYSMRIKLFFILQTAHGT